MSNFIPKILVLFSSPLVDENNSPINTLDIQAEREAIVKELSECNRQITLKFDFATVDTLSSLMKEHFDILHFSGHGSKEYLAFEDGEGGCQPVDGNLLSKIIGIGSPFNLAIISACYSESLAKMVNKAGVRHVIAIKRNFPILDRAATRFAGVFYRELFAGDTIQHAFDTAKLLVESDPHLVKVKPLMQV
jgi:CHAT domain-containing protein